MINVWFDGWEPVGRIVVVGTLAYLALVVLLRASGKRTLSQMNSFDFVITVALGATFGRVLTARSIPLAEAVTAFSLLVFLQFVVTALQIRSARFRDGVTAAPRLLAYRGQVMKGALHTERITESEVEAAVRKHGFGSLHEVEAVVIEADGRLAVVGKDRAGDRSALRPVDGYGRGETT